MTGKIKMLNGERGFGFIKRDDGKGDIFFHHSAMPKGLFKEVDVGQIVSFDEERASDGRTRAINVTT